MRPELLTLLLLAGCAPHHAPPFATVPYAPFSRSAAVAIALDEWRLWGSRVDDDDGAGYVQTAATMAERQPGLWQRVGEYWWEGVSDEPDARYTGKHDANGAVFPVAANGDFAWSAAFISYVMRIAGAGHAFPYAPDHSYYIEYAVRAAAGAVRAPLLVAKNPASYAPQLGDLACFPRGTARALTFADLPKRESFPAHCSIVVSLKPLAVIGGNVDDAVTLEHLHTDSAGHLAGNAENWFAILHVDYRAP